VQGRGLRHLAQVGAQPALALRDRLQLPLRVVRFFEASR
jgi:hypothetical protein